MSKSLGNFITVDAVLEEHHPAFVRYAVLQHHYRSPMEFSDAQLSTMKRGWQRLNRAYQQMLEKSGPCRWTKPGYSPPLKAWWMRRPGPRKSFSKRWPTTLTRRPHWHRCLS